MGPPSDSDRSQGDALCVELHEEIAKLEDQAEKARRYLTKYRSLRSRDQLSRVQSQLKAVIEERGKLIGMLAAMGHGYPCDHTRG